ncbi:putative replication initiation protein [Mytilus sp. clam associated circular virus]|uniref:Putative replication initiation protein n=1 Tax=Mytilus sp. clam associated circular virus TaxID=1692256 RepID=A0A0K1RL85_9CIRC|nr:putative replication initiation protein [Mytilus sp. clam associated circular virus]AKV62289.1 putative replication initiation protein [Mytilus sp. clam associated circular virus]
MSQAKRWCFTINNPTPAEEESLFLHGTNIDHPPCDFKYLVFGRETGESGTPHLQGYFELVKKLRIHQIKGTLGFERSHLEVARGTSLQASDYCKKENAFEEFGALPPPPGNAAHFAQLREWVAAQPSKPTIKDVWDVFPTLAARYNRAVMECIDLFGKKPVLVEGDLRLWQLRLDGIANQEADDRRVIFVIDPEGNKGKSWLVSYWLSTRDDTQFMSVGKRDDLAYAVDISTCLFVFDIPRGNMQYIQYGIFEQLKNRVVFSNKYSSQTKILLNTPHVFVFANELPDMNALSADRYKVINI